MLTSAATVIAGLSLMGTTRFKLFSSTGPSVALGLALTLAASLTLTPALLVLLARHRPRSFAGLSHHTGAFWDRLATQVLRRPLLTWLATLAVMVPPAVLGLRTVYLQDTLTEMPAETASVQALRQVAEEFGLGFLAPLTVVLETQSPSDNLKESEGLALIDDASRFLSQNRRLHEVRSATQPLGSTALFDPARISARLGAVDEGFDKMADGATQLHDGLIQGVAKIRLAIMLESAIKGQIGRLHSPPAAAAPAPASGPSTAHRLVIERRGDGHTPRQRAEPCRQRRRQRHGGRGHARARRQRGVRPPPDADPGALACRCRRGQIAEGARRAVQEVAEILQDPVGRHTLDRLLVTPRTVREHPDLVRSFAAYISPDGQRARIDVVQGERMNSEAAMDQVVDLRRRLGEYLAESRGVKVKAGFTGANADSADIRALTRSDQHKTWLIVPAGVFLILLIALRDPWACLNLVATMILTYAFALGITHAGLRQRSGRRWARLEGALLPVRAARGRRRRLQRLPDDAAPRRVAVERPARGNQEGGRGDGRPDHVGRRDHGVQLCVALAQPAGIAPPARLRAGGRGHGRRPPGPAGARPLRPLADEGLDRPGRGRHAGSSGGGLHGGVDCMNRPRAVPSGMANVCVDRRFFPGNGSCERFQWRGKADSGPGPDPCWLSRRIPMSRQALTRSFVALGIAVGCASLTWAQAAPPQKVASVEGITEYRLDNGLRVLLFPDPSRPKVTVNMTVFVGSRHEGYGETGMAHLLEHMLFKGTPGHPDIPKVLKERGAQFNGTTWFDRTNYYETLTASDENLEFALKLEADRLVNSFIKGSDLATEMTVVRNEFEMGENSPENILEQRMMAVAYEWHNYGKSTIGNRSDIERVPIERLQGFYRKHYRPDNALLVVAGQVRREEGPRPDLQVLRRPAAAGVEGRHALYRGAGPGRRADRHAEARRRRRRGRRALPCPGRGTPGVRRGADLDPDPDLGPVGPALQGPRRDQEGVPGERPGLLAARPGRRS